MFTFDIHNVAYGQETIIENCKFELPEKQICALIGPSGCGKTTILNIIAGLRSFPNNLIKLDCELSYIFQNARLVPWLTVAQNLSLVRPSITPSEIDNVLSEVKLIDVKNHYPTHLSGGMQKRVSIARAFVNHPKLVLLDEPFSSLDKPTAEHLCALVERLIRQNDASAILVTHNLQEALSIADKLYFLGSKPTRMIKQLSNPLKRNAVNDKTISIESVSDALLKEHPHLLSGIC